MSTITAVAKCQKFNPGEDTTTVSFYPAYDNPLNAEWSKYTPALSVHMSILNEVAEKLDAGAEYLITFEKREVPNG
jgi:hypothetical protein